MAFPAGYGLDNRLNYARRSRLILTIIPRYMAQVFDWLYVGKSQRLHDFLHSKSNGLKGFDRSELDIIQCGRGSKTMNVTLLYKLLQRVCGLKTDDKSWHTTPQAGVEASLEQLLYQLKQYRNDVSHLNPETLLKVTDTDLDSLVKELKELLTKMLQQAGRRAGRGQDEIDGVVSRMEKDLREERNSETSLTLEEFVSRSRLELQNSMRKTMDLYVEPRFVVDICGAFKRIMYLEDLFSCRLTDGSLPEVFLVTGEAGAGKSSLCRAVLESWLHDQDRVKSVGKYQLVLSLHCAGINSSDLHRHLTTRILPSTTALCEGAELTRLLWQMKVLWIVDGWDEATKEAKRLLQDLLHARPSCHTVLVTSRPDLGASFAEVLREKKLEKFLKISFSGLNINEQEKILRGHKTLDHDRNSVERFMEFMKKIPEEVKKDLSNPLKLQLTAEEWCFHHGAVERQRPLSLSRIFLNRIAWQRKHLIKRCEAEAAPGQAVHEKIDDWLRCLYKEAFNSVKDGPKLALSDKGKKTLQKDCGVRPSHCLSTFLEVIPGSEASPGGPHYSFSHTTQRSVFAAQYLNHSCSGTADPEAKLREVLEDGLTEQEDYLNPYLGIFDLLLQLLIVLRILICSIFHACTCQRTSLGSISKALRCLGRKFINFVKGRDQPKEVWDRASLVRNFYFPVLFQVLEAWAEGSFQASLSARGVVDLFSFSLEGSDDPEKWFQVVRKSGLHDDLVREVARKVSTQSWVIYDSDLSAACALLRHVVSKQITVIIMDDPKRLPLLGCLLSDLADRQVSVHLHLMCHFTKALDRDDLSDHYLGLVCRGNSKCKLRVFSGHLSPAGIQRLSAAPDLERLLVRVTKPDAVGTLVTQNLFNLNDLHLVYDHKKFILPKSSLNGSLGIVRSLSRKLIARPLNVNLQLLHLSDTSVNSAVNFIARLSKRYVWLTIGGLTQRGVRPFIIGLKNNEVLVDNLIRGVYIKQLNHVVSVNFGPLPLTIPLNMFVKHWHDVLKGL